MIVLQICIHELKSMLIYFAQEPSLYEDSPANFASPCTGMNLSRELKCFLTSVEAIDTGMSQWRLPH